MQSKASPMFLPTAQEANLSASKTQTPTRRKRKFLKHNCVRGNRICMTTVKPQLKRKSKRN
eukprot:1365528-Lingulodinium_polyedra.AAC.1